MALQFATREQWLKAALTRVSAGWPAVAELPENVRVSVGWPVKTRGAGKGRLSEHYMPRESAGGVYEIFISPTLAEAAAVCRAVALEAAAIATGRAPGADEARALTARADKVAATMPAYPHDALAGPEPAPAGSVGSRYLRTSCPECGYSMRVTRKWLIVAVPSCPSGHGTMHVSQGDIS